jgi:hypothetical protein
MAGKNPAKLAETGKGCSSRRAGAPSHSNKKLFYFNGLMPRPRVARNWHCCWRPTSWGAGDEWDA